MLAAWRYLTAHPVFWTYLVPPDLVGIDPREVDEATWARIEAEGWLSDDQGLAHLDVSLARAGERVEVRMEHGPVLWPLDVPAPHRTGLRVGGATRQILSAAASKADIAYSRAGTAYARKSAR